MLPINKTLLLNENVEFDSFMEEYEYLQEMKKIKQIAKSVDKASNVAVKSLINGVRGLHSTKDENLVERTPELSKVITKAIVIGGTFSVNPVLGLITLFTSMAVKNKNDANRRQKLRDMYSAKLEFLEGKINKLEEDDEEKLRLIKLRNKLRTDLEKLKRIQDATGEE
jgi:hypothetical protein